MELSTLTMTELLNFVDRRDPEVNELARRLEAYRAVINTSFNTGYVPPKSVTGERNARTED